MIIKFNNTWDKVLREDFKKEYFVKLVTFLKEEYESKTIYPEKENIFNALKYTDYNDVKVVIIGQDPYHEYGQAHGLAFSVLDNVKLPPSLKNIFKELSSDLGIPFPTTGNLTNWAKQGVLLLNTVLTVRESHANSHKNKGWEIFTSSIIKSLNNKSNTIVFLLWGNDAKTKQDLITNPKHVVLTTVHPSPLSAYNGFFGCKHFSKTNQILKSTNQSEIDWRL